MDLDELKDQYYRKQQKVEDLELENSNYSDQINAIRSVIEQIKEINNYVDKYKEHVVNSYYRFNSGEYGTKWAGEAYKIFSETIDQTLYPDVRDYFYELDNVCDELESEERELRSLRDKNEDLLKRTRDRMNDLWYDIRHFF